jgi:predicted nucleic acid-binding protein
VIAVDANILVELLESRDHLAAVQAAINRHVERGERFAISTLTVSTVFYLAEAHKIALQRVEGLIARYELYDVTPADVDWALAH